MSHYRSTEHRHRSPEKKSRNDSPHRRHGDHKPHDDTRKSSPKRPDSPDHRKHNGFHKVDDKEKSREYDRDSRNVFDKNPMNKKNDLLTVNLPSIDWGKTDLIPFEKNLYKEHPNVSKRSTREVEEWRKEKTIHLKSRSAPNPITTFDEASFPPYIMDQFKRCGFKEPTPIQAQGWPIAMKGRDAIGIACTGSGKTLAFVLPALIHIGVQPKLRPGDGPIALVLAPTRELSVQIYEECLKFTRGGRINVAVVYGGADKYSQKRELLKGSEIVIATPGRLIDFLDSRVTNLKRVTYLVLDEADRMLDMGFEPQIRKIVSQIRPDRQTLMWSATWPVEIQRLARDFCKEDPVHVVVGSEELAVNHMIKQHIEIMDDRMKKPRLVKLLQTIMDGSKILIFCQTKKGCDYLARHLTMENWPVVAIHGDKSQHERDTVMNQFKTGKYPILVATDVAARGLDVKDVKYVINFDFPTQIEDYVHRVGRTGRAGANGIAYTFLTEDNGKFAKELIDVLEEAKQTVPRELEQLAERNSYLRKRPTNNRWQKPSGGRNDNFNRNDRGKSNGYGGGYGNSGQTNSYNNTSHGTNNSWSSNAANSNSNGTSYGGGSSQKYPNNFSWNQNGGHLYQQPYAAATGTVATNGPTSWNQVPLWSQPAETQKLDTAANTAYGLPMSYYPTVQPETKESNGASMGYYTFAPPTYDYTATAMNSGSAAKPEPPGGIPPAKPKGRFSDWSAGPGDGNSGADAPSDQQGEDNSKSNPVLIE